MQTNISKRAKTQVASTVEQARMSAAHGRLNEMDLYERYSAKLEKSQVSYSAGPERGQVFLGEICTFVTLLLYLKIAYLESR